MLPASVIGLRIDSPEGEQLGVILIESNEEDLDAQAARLSLSQSLSIRMLTTFIHSSISQLNSLATPERKNEPEPSTER